MPDAVTTARIRVLIVDDHPMLRDGVAAVIGPQPDMIVVGEAEDGAQALEIFEAARPDVTLMDLQMPGMSGLQAIAAIRKMHPQARILVLTTYSGDVQALRALKAGAAGYLLKSSLRKELIDTIRAVHAGRRHLPPEIANEIAVHSGEASLSPREVEILQLVAAGDANKQIAWLLSLSEDTIKAHLKNIFLKLGVSDRTHAVTVAMRRGVLDI